MSEVWVEAMTIYLISDTHFGHRNIINYCGRPFKDEKEMDEFLITSWNARVRPSDHVYHLGDVAMRRPDLQVVRRLQGHKRLVLGNHDIYHVRSYLEVGFEKIFGSRVLSNLILTHLPIHPGSKGRFLANVHGHIHNNHLSGWDPYYFNVSCEMIAYAPLSLEEVIARVGAQQAHPEWGRQRIDEVCEVTPALWAERGAYAVAPAPIAPEEAEEDKEDNDEETPAF